MSACRVIKSLDHKQSWYLESNTNLFEHREDLKRECPTAYWRADAQAWYVHERDMVKLLDFALKHHDVVVEVDGNLECRPHVARHNKAVS